MDAGGSESNQWVPIVEIIIIKSDTSFDDPTYDDITSDDPTSDDTTYAQKTTARLGPPTELLKWYNDTIDEDIPQFQLPTKHSMSKGSISKPQKSPTYGIVAYQNSKGKRKGGTGRKAADQVKKEKVLQSRKGTVDNSFTLGSTEAFDNVKILQSCNGLLLCTGLEWPAFDYIYNPSTNLFKRLLQPDYTHDDSPFHRSVRLRMAFDPTKSLNYKVVHVRRISCDIDIQIYSLETRNWSLCRD
ncbi:hypothetical protein Tco_0948124 [Tanacetum coccineum]